MSHFVIGDDPALFLAHNAVFLFLADKNDFHRFKKILLADHLSAVFYRIDGRLIDHIGQIRSDRAGRCQSDRFQIHALIHSHIFRMDFQDIHTAPQVRFIHDDTPVKTARAQERRIQDLRPVRCSQDQKSLIRIKSIHLRQELVQCLFPFVIAAQGRVTGLSDCVDLIDKYDARRLLLGLLEQVAHTGRADAHIHFHKGGSRQREERYFRLACYCFCKKRLSGSRRSHKECAFREFRTDPAVFARIMEKIHHFLKGFFCLVLPGHILECNARLFLHIHLGVALTDAHHAAAFGHPAHQPDKHGRHQADRQDQCQEKLQKHLAQCVSRLAAELHAGVFQRLDQIIVIDITGIIIRVMFHHILLRLFRPVCIAVIPAAGFRAFRAAGVPAARLRLHLFLDPLQNRAGAADQPILRHLLTPRLVGEGNVDTVAVKRYLLHISVIHHLKKFIIADLFRPRAAHQRIKSHHYKSDQQGCNEDDPPALPVVIRVVFSIIIHYVPPKNSYFHYKDRFCINQ